MSEQGEQKRPVSLKQTRWGTVSSTKGRCTIRVDVDNQVMHPRYGKYVRKRVRMAVHDPNEIAKQGDVVEIAPCRRISKTKSWRLIRVIRSATLVSGSATKE
jgi:small subunit ribosomal protein S17